MGKDQNSATDIDHMNEWIGREEVVVDRLSADLVRKYHATVDFPGDPPGEGEAAPQLIHFCLAQPAAPTAGLGPDGHPARGGFLPPVPLPRRMWAGGEISFLRELRVGQEICRVSRIENVQLKEGRTGALCFVTIRHLLVADNAPAIEERQDVVYRGLDAPGAGGKALAPAPKGAHRRTTRAEAPLLFRYSALTFNGHRIHYDRRYVTQIEGYPGLIVHGPLQAALLCNYALELRGERPTRFRFRGLSPLFDDDIFTLHASPLEDGFKLWTATENGPVAMEAEAFWN